jgi:glutamyl-Q tRNA(Asp) synthetase
MTAAAAHVGRFAPSPTGPLHFGSLVAALGSRVAAHAGGGCWLLRIDDIDPPRQPAGAIDTILRQLEAFGLHWDRAVIRQSTRTERYEATLETLRAAGAAYPCTCTRREITDTGGRGPLGPVYPGLCRGGPLHPERDRAWRLRLAPAPLALDDAVQGPCTLDPKASIGDVVLRRRDGLWAYHLANAVDDAELGITRIVRGADLLPSALVEVALLERLGHAPPAWMHLPVAQTRAGDKLSKQTGALAIDPSRPLPALLAAWRLLGQEPPPEPPDDVESFHAHALRAWRPDRIPPGPVQAPAPEPADARP